jgi:hypothetical protein
VNFDKSNFIPAETSTGQNDLPQNLAGLSLCPEGAELLGAPIGTTTFENSRCLDKVRNLRKLLLVQSETSIPTQYRFLLLKDAVIPTLNYLLRTVPPSNRTSATQAFDNAVKSIVRALLGGAEWGDPWEIEQCPQIHLPMRYGGLGLPLASHISETAYLASTWEAGVHLDESTRKQLIDTLKEKKVDIEETWLSSRPPSRKQQSQLSQQVHDAKFYRLLQDIEDDAGKARLQAARQAGAQDWLTALPTNPSQRYTDLHWRLLARLRLGLPVSNREIPAVCPLCHNFVEDLGQHALACRHREMKHHQDNRHNKLRDALIGCFLHWGMDPKKEPLIQQGSQDRGDIEINQPQGPVVLDVSVTSISSVKGLQKGNPKAATTIRESEKINKYGNSCQEQNKDFRPLVFQTFGGIGSKGLNFFRELKSRPPCLKVVNSSHFVEATRKRLSCLLMHSHAKMILRWMHLALPPSHGGVRGLQ